MDIETRRTLVATDGVTLDGQRARIYGARNRFATVASLEDHARSAEYAWATVAHVVANGAAFRT